MGELTCNTDKYECVVNMARGNEDNGRIYGSNRDFGIGVYDVLSPETVGYLENVSLFIFYSFTPFFFVKILVNLRDSRGNMAVAGLGVECRGSGSGRDVGVPLGTAARLGRVAGCRSTELVACDGVIQLFQLHSLFYLSIKWQQASWHFTLNIIQMNLLLILTQASHQVVVIRIRRRKRRRILLLKFISLFFCFTPSCDKINKF